jgi:hypothetical protein
MRYHRINGRIHGILQIVETLEGDLHAWSDHRFLFRRSHQCDSRKDFTLYQDTLTGKYFRGESTPSICLILILLESRFCVLLSSKPSLSPGSTVWTDSPKTSKP